MASPDNKSTRKKNTVPGLRKPMIIGLAAFCLVISLWAIIQGLSGSRSGKKTADITPSTTSTVPPSSLNSLPGSYSSSKMDNFRPKPEATRPYENVSALKSQLATLTSNYQQLQSQLGQLQQQQQSSEPKKQPEETEGMSDIEKQRARQSPLLIPVATMMDEERSPSRKNNNKTQGNDDEEEAKVHYPKSKNELLAGSSIPAVLQTEVVSDLPGSVVGIVRQNVYDSIRGTKVLIPKGTRLIGVYQSNVIYGQSSLQVAFNRLIRPDGSSIDLAKFPGTSPLGTSGLGEDVNNHWGAVFGSALLSSVFSIPAILASNSQYASSSCVTGKDENGQYIYGPCGTGGQAKSAALQSLGQAASQVGSRVTSRALALKPTVLIHPGYTFSVLVTKDLALPPYASH